MQTIIYRKRHWLFGFFGAPQRIELPNEAAVRWLRNARRERNIRIVSIRGYGDGICR